MQISDCNDKVAYSLKYNTNTVSPKTASLLTNRPFTLLNITMSYYGANYYKINVPLKAGRHHLDDCGLVLLRKSSVVRFLCSLNNQNVTVRKQEPQRVHTLSRLGLAAMKPPTICLWEWTRVGAAEGLDQWGHKSLAVAKSRAILPLLWVGRGSAQCLH